MATKEVGRVDPSGNYGLGQTEADKARKWAADRKNTAIFDSWPPQTATPPRWSKMGSSEATC